MLAVDCERGLFLGSPPVTTTESILLPESVSSYLERVISEYSSVTTGIVDHTAGGEDGRDQVTGGTGERRR